MTLVACVPYTGYVPGQIIPITVELDNNSNVAINAVKVILERVIFLNGIFSLYSILFFILGSIISSKSS